MSLKDRKILLGITGGIAAYKSAQLVRSLIQREAGVRVVMTRSAQAFIQPLTFEVLSQNPVYTELFPATREYNILHVSLAQWADLVLIAPATANIIGKIAGGIADDLLSTVAMACPAPKLLAPAMETHMLENPIVAGNIEKLRNLSYRFVEPGEGFLASGAVGRGRMAEPEAIVQCVEEAFAPSADLDGLRILVTAGPTQEDLDPIRFLTNHSTGKMGYAIAERAHRRGATVLLVSGPTHLSVPEGVERVGIRSVEELHRAVDARFDECDALIMAAAPADYRSKHVATHKIHKAEDDLVLELERTEDILASVGPRKGDRVLVGFSMETEAGVERAREKLVRKNLDLIVLNDVTVQGAGFGTDTNVVTLLDPDGGTESLPRMSKHDVADRILDRVARILGERTR